MTELRWILRSSRLISGEQGVSVVGEFVASDCQVKTMCFGLRQLDVADKVGVGIFLPWVWPVWRQKILCS